VAKTEATLTAGPLLGPVDRIHFLKAQARHRRASWRASLFAPIAVVAAGIPLCAVVTPVLVIPFMVVAFLFDLVFELPQSVAQLPREIAHLGPSIWYQLWHGFPSMPWLLLAMLLVVPGAVLMAAAWIAIRVLFRHAWTGGWLKRLETRAPDGLDLGERRVVNMIEELAVAAGTPPPRVVIIDSPAANAVALGLTMDDATIAVSTGLVKALSRDEAQAYLAHLVGSIGNGDLKIAASLLSVFQAWGLLALIVEAPFSAPARAALGLVGHAAIDAVRGRAKRDEAESAMGLLLDGGDQSYGNLGSYLDAVEREHSLAVNVFVDLPFMLTMCLASIVARAAIGLFTIVVFGPVMALIWRTRKRLADASAVELTRNPEALAGAVRKLVGGEVEIPHAAPISFLFPIWRPKAELDPDRTDVTGEVLGMHLDAEERLARLAAMGANTTQQPLPAEKESRFHDACLLLVWAFMTLIGFAFLLAVHLATMGLLLWIVWTGLNFIFIGLPSWAAGLVSR
jgi:Zn-dependent protease with chaperone function